MAKHEEKYCPKCKTKFECKVGSILICQCSKVQLNHEELSYLHSKYEDCLCAKCMQELKSEYHNDIFQKKLKSILGIFYKDPKK